MFRPSDGHVEVKMTAVDLFEATPSPVRSPFHAMQGLLRSLWRQRRQRLALASLLQMDPARLSDLGITPGDVLDALQVRPDIQPSRR